MAFLSCLSIVIPAFAYDISGIKLTELPPQFKYNPYAAETAYTLNQNYAYETIKNGKDPISCKYTTTGKFTSCTWSTTALVDLPNWVNKTNATQNAQTEWNRFIAAVQVHENGHVKIVNDFKQDKTASYTDKLLKISVTGSGDTQEAATADAIAKLKTEANKNYDDALQELNGLNDKYDADTNHGVTQGAVLNTSIN